MRDKQVILNEIIANTARTYGIIITEPVTPFNRRNILNDLKLKDENAWRILTGFVTTAEAYFYLKSDIELRTKSFDIWKIQCKSLLSEFNKKIKELQSLPESVTVLNDELVSELSGAAGIH